MSAIMDKVKGRLKKIEGKITGSRAKKAEGAVQEGVGDAKLEGGAVVDNVKAGVSRAKAKIKGGLAGSGRRPPQR